MLTHACRLLLAGSLLAAPLAGQFNLFDWSLQDDSGDGYASLTPSTMFVSAEWFSQGGGAILAWGTVAPVDARITLDMHFIGFDGTCGASVPIFMVDGAVTILASCGDFKSLVLSVPAGAEFALGLITFDGSWPGTVTFTDFSYEPVPPVTVWTDLGQGLAGSLGVPQLIGVSLLYPHLPLTLNLLGAAPSSPTTLVVGLSQLGAPFKGGVLVPSPDLLVTGLLTSSGGKLVLSTHWPGGVPAGLSLTLQAWIVDAAGPAGLSASNALRAVVP